MTRRYAFVEWMKCLGMLAIVYGHVAGATTIRWTAPIHLKQLGVALFMFVIGFGLARSSANRWHVVWNRAVETCVIGLGFAVLMSAVVFAARGDLNESNYLPFLLGANVFFNNFPANPTTWFIGTYLHVLLLWALVLRRVHVRGWMIPASMVFEAVTRALIWRHAGEFVAYMALPNWSTVLLLGLWQGQRHDRHDRMPGAIPVTVMGAGVIGWAVVSANWSSGFPFMTIDSGAGPLLDRLIASTLVSAWYLVAVVGIFEATRVAVCPAIVRFFARNTIVVFVAHMPVYYLIDPPLAPLNYWFRVAIEMAVCFVLLSCLSEGLHRVVSFERLRNRTWGSRKAVSDVASTQHV